VFFLSVDLLNIPISSHVLSLISLYCFS